MSSEGGPKPGTAKTGKWSRLANEDSTPLCWTILLLLVKMKSSKLAVLCVTRVGWSMTCFRPRACAVSFSLRSKGVIPLC